MIAAKLRDVRVSPSPERIGELICLIVFFLSYWPTLLAGTVASDGRFPEILETGNRRRHNRVFFFFSWKSWTRNSTAAAPFRRGSLCARMLYFFLMRSQLFCSF